MARLAAMTIMQGCLLRNIAGWVRRRDVRLVLVMLISLSGLVSGCGGSVGGDVGFQPVLLPVKFTLDQSGVNVRGQKELVTPMGVFSVGAKYTLPANGDDAIYVIIRNRKEGTTGFDHTYQVQTGRGEFSAVVNGKTLIQVVNRQVLIDITDGSIEDIQLRSAEPAVATDNSDLAGRVVSKWSNYWNWALYEPFSLFRWAYDDSTISDWYGLGFAWFLIRLVLALLLLIPDLILSGVFLLSGVAYVLFGEAARNIVFGVFSLFALLIVAVGVAVARE